MEMQLAASFLDLDPAKGKLHKGVFKGPWYTVLANIYGVSRSDIEQRDRNRKAWKRRIATTLVAGIIAVLAGALIVALIQYKEAVSEQERAEKARDDAEGLVDFMVFDLRDKLKPIGRLDLLDSVNQRINEYYESLASESPTKDVLRRQSAALINNGNVLAAQGRLDDAIAAFIVAKDTLKKLSVKDPSNTQWAIDLATSHNNVGELLMEKGQLDDARTVFIEGKNICEKLIAQDPSNTGWVRDLAVSYGLIGDANQAKKNHIDAFVAYGKTVQFIEHYSVRNQGSLVWTSHLWYNLQKQAEVSQELGEGLKRQGREEEARRLFEVSLTIRELVKNLEAANPQWQIVLSASRIYVGDVLAAENRLEDATGAYISSKSIAERLTLQDPNNTEWQHVLATALWREAGIAFVQGQKSDAAAVMDRAANIYARLAETLNTPEARTESSKAWDFLSWYLLFAIDLTSPSLIKACASGRHLKEAVVTVQKAGPTPQQFLIVKLYDEIVKTVETGVDTLQSSITENVALTFSRIEFIYEEQKPDGTLGGSSKILWDIINNKVT